MTADHHLDRRRPRPEDLTDPIEVRVYLSDLRSADLAHARREASALAAHASDITSAAALLEEAVIARLNDEDLATAERLAGMALKKGELAGNPNLQGWAHYELGEDAWLHGDLDRAESSFAAALAHGNSINLASLRSSALTRLGKTSRRRGDLQQAAERCQEAYDIALDQGDPHAINQGNALLELAECERLRNRWSAAESSARRAIAAYRTGNDVLGEHNARLELAKTLRLLGNLSGAKAEAAGAVSGYGSIGYRLGRANALLEVGKVALLNLELEEGKRVLTEAAFLYDELDEPLGQGNTRLALGELHLIAGNFDLGGTSLRSALELTANGRDIFGHLNLLVMLAQADRAVGAYGRARETLVTAAELSREHPERTAVVMVLLERARLERTAKRLDTAEILLKEALAVAKEIAQPDVVVSCLLDLADAREAQSDADAAASYRREARQSLPDDTASANQLRLRVDLAVAADELRGGRLELNQAISLVERAKDDLGNAPTALTILGGVFEQLSQESDALQAYVEAVDKLDKARLKLGRAPERGSYFRSRRPFYLRALRPAIRAGDGPLVVRLMGHARAEGLTAALLAGQPLAGPVADALATLRLSLGSSALSEGTLREVADTISQAMVDLMVEGSDDGPPIIPVGVNTLLLDLVPPPGAEDDSDGSLTRDTEVAGAWIDEFGTIRPFLVPFPPEARRVLNCWNTEPRWRTRRRDRFAIESLAQSLLPEALRRVLRDGPVADLAIVPAGPIWSVPFSALPIADKVLAELARVVVVPAVSLVLGGDTQREKLQSGLIAALTEVPGVRYERAALANPSIAERLGPVEIVTQRDELLSSLARDTRGVLIISAHGEDADLFGSNVSLADANLGSTDLLAARLPALVVLGACKVGRLDYELGEDPLGMPVAALLGGARWVVAATSEIEGQGAGRVLARFYAKISEGHSVPEALRQAQVALARNWVGHLRRPERWAALSVLETR